MHLAKYTYNSFCHETSSFRLILSFTRFLGPQLLDSTSQKILVLLWRRRGYPIAPTFSLRILVIQGTWISQHQISFIQTYSRTQLTLPWVLYPLESNMSLVGCIPILARENWTNLAGSNSYLIISVDPKC